VLQLRQRFQIFPSAVQFNLMPEEVALPPQFFRSWWVYVKAVFTRFKLRYGWAVGGVKEDSKQLEAGRFAKIWNHIIDIFREEDLISDRFSSFPSQLFLRWVCGNFLDLDLHYAFTSKFFLVKFFILCTTMMLFTNWVPQMVESSHSGSHPHMRNLATG
jgi:hypothetical protein